MRKKLILSMVLVLILLVGLLVACDVDPDPVDPDIIDIENIELDKEYDVLLVDGTSKLIATITPENATNQTILWATSFDDIIDIDEEGNITAKAPGIATISANAEESDFTANATIYVGNAIVSTEFTEATEGYGENKFSIVSEAVEAMEEDSVIVIMSGDYGESLEIDKSISLVGIEYPKLSSISMITDETALKVRGIDFYNAEFPTGGEATIKGAIDGEMHIVDCKFIIENEEEPTGGYAIYASAGTDKISVKSSTIDNYRYGIYTHRAGATFEITNNTFTNLSIGIGVDIRVPNSNPPTNYPAMGEINDNTFVEVVTRAEFFFNGDSYDGNLDFAEFTPDEMD